MKRKDIEYKVKNVFPELSEEEKKKREEDTARILYNILKKYDKNEISEDKKNQIT